MEFVADKEVEDASKMWQLQWSCRPVDGGTFDSTSLGKHALVVVQAHSTTCS